MSTGIGRHRESADGCLVGERDAEHGRIVVGAADDLYASWHAVVGDAGWHRQNRTDG